MSTTTELFIDVDSDDSDYTANTSNADSDDDNNSTMSTLSDTELVRLHKDQSVNVDQLLDFPDDDGTDDEMSTREQQVDKKELVELYNDQSVPIEELVPVSNVQEPSNSKSIYSMVRSISMKTYIIKFGMFISNAARFLLTVHYTKAAPVAVALAYAEPVLRQSRDQYQCLAMNTTTTMFIIKSLYLVFILCAPVLLINYSYKLKIDALVRDIIIELQAKRERHVNYPHICPSATMSVTQIRSNIVNPTHLSTFEDWQCVEAKLNEHPLLRKSMQEERGDFIEYYEILI
ncbi:hypothetical protein MBANPS3_004043 [Mucor bainieri]